VKKIKKIGDEKGAEKMAFFDERRNEILLQQKRTI
jgi:hypothetical protein